MNATPDRVGRLEVGRIVGAHGLAGEVRVWFTSNRPERSQAGSVLYSGDRAFVVVAARPHRGGMLVRFEGIADRTAAEHLRGTVLSGDPLPADGTLDEHELWVHEVIGAQVVDPDGRVLGEVVSVEARGW